MSMEDDTSPRSTKGDRRRHRKPHNARVRHFATLSEIVDEVGAEMRSFPTPDGSTKISRKQRLYRVMIHAALKDSDRDLAHLLRLMIKNPNIITFRGEVQYFMTKNLWSLL